MTLTSKLGLSVVSAAEAIREGQPQLVLLPILPQPFLLQAASEWHPPVAPSAWHLLAAAILVTTLVVRPSISMVMAVPGTPTTIPSAVLMMTLISKLAPCAAHAVAEQDDEGSLLEYLIFKR